MDSKNPRAKIKPQHREAGTKTVNLCDSSNIFVLFFFSGGDYITYRLFGGISPTEGVLQYRSSANETWNTVCTSWPFQDYATASIFCSKVGFPFACGYDTVGNVRNSSVIAGLLRDFPSKESSIFCTVTYNGEHDCLPVSTGLSSRPCALLNTTTWLVCSSGN